MFAYIKGKLEMKFQDYLVVEANGGVGYKIFMSSNSMKKIGEIGDEIKIYTYLRVREDDISLFGFYSNEELRMFELLLSVSGIGAKSALGILSNITPSNLALAVISNDVSTLKSLPGIGAKSAARMVLELKDKLKTESAVSKDVSVEVKEAIVEDNKVSEAISALMVLGYTRKEVEQVFVKIKEKDTLSVEELIRKALMLLAR